MERSKSKIDIERESVKDTEGLKGRRIERQQVEKRWQTYREQNFSLSKSKMKNIHKNRELQKDGKIKTKKH